MKLCICCGATAEDNALTCPKCGEASWARKSSAFAVANEAVASAGVTVQPTEDKEEVTVTPSAVPGKNDVIRTKANRR